MKQYSNNSGSGFGARSGGMDLPLHGGRAPSWLFEKMVKLARAMIEVIAADFGAEEILKRMSDPLWFQAFGCVLGYDWHSSGLTTVVCGAVKEAVKPLSKDLGLFVCGGKGRTSRKTPSEIASIGRSGFISESLSDKLTYSSRMSAKVDSALVQDGYSLYHHVILFTRSGRWAVVQQGMNPENKYARRYHWHSSESGADQNYIIEPHEAVCCDSKNKTFNLTDKKIDKTRSTVAELSADKPYRLIKEIKRLPAEHTISPSQLGRVERTLLSTYEKPAKDFEDLVSRKGIGPKTIRALSMVSHLCCGTPVSWKDPAEYSFAHGGKDGVPYPVDEPSYEKTIETLRLVLSESKVGRSEKKQAFLRLGRRF